MWAVSLKVRAIGPRHAQGARIAATGGRTYTQRQKQSPIRRGNGAEQTQGFECHATLENRDYVFTSLRHGAVRRSEGERQR